MSAWFRYETRLTVIAPGLCDGRPTQPQTSWSGSLNPGIGRNNTQLETEKITVVGPIPNAIVNTAVAVRSGLLFITRAA
jgi:hypothetical protein